MVQISRRRIKEEVLNKLLDIFLSSILKIRDKKSAERFFAEFLTSTEKIMLTKRIVCMYLLFKKVPIREIADVLKLSTSTVGKYSLFMSKNKTINEIFEKILFKESLIKLIDTVIHEYISPPTKYGTDWSAGWEIHKEYLKRKRSPI